ncbi:hypothetical protein LAZ67_4001351 [Cordylochernes scorpioides]|uniref:Transposase n=1 Tax=Cordylochernes scorpioides TaxID=51811 RepID=A0ABY6KEY0_9ARAC|nr:hypothetical protein LAZ67_4001351 [Cordylochernes scorpioides]
MLDPETKRQSVEWRGQGELRPKKSRILKSRNKVLLVAFLDNKSIVHHEYLPAGQTVIKEIDSKKRPDKLNNSDWILHHNNARPHTAHLVTSFLAKNGTQILSQPPYFPDIAPNYFLLFPKLKAVLKGRHFDNRDDILENSLLALKSIPKEANKYCFDNREKRWRWWVKKGRITLKKWQAIYSSQPIRASLVANLIKVLNRAPFIRLCWVHRPTGINGNELADCAAKIAATSVLPHSYSTLP